MAATGTASGPPDRAILTLGASAVRADVASALEVVNGKTADLVSVLAAHGIQGPDIQTSDLSIWPEHDNQGAVAGFRVRNTVRISTGRLEALGETISAATTALGDLAEMNGLSFEITDRSPLEARARAQAWDRAHEKASQLAGLAGTRLGRALEIIETSGHGLGPMVKRAVAMSESATVEAGSASIEVHLTVRFTQFPDDTNSAQ